jgi:hypothetical protein
MVPVAHHEPEDLLCFLLSSAHVSIRSLSKKHVFRRRGIHQTLEAVPTRSRGHRMDDHFTIDVPLARAVNPISNKNWEGMGVEMFRSRLRRQSLTRKSWRKANYRDSGGSEIAAQPEIP